MNAADNYERLDGAEAIEAYRMMRLIRRFEERVRELVTTSKVAGVCHECIGQEAAAVGACQALRKTDLIASTHRAQGHTLAKGVRPEAIMAELFGKASGVNKGKGGSMHYADKSLGHYGANGILGAGLPIVAGGVWAARQRGETPVAVAFYGDGAAGQGVVHETMNLAAVWKLPVVFVCENNLYAITSAVKDMSSVQNFADRASAYGMMGESVDGMDVEAVWNAVRRHAAAARDGGGPSLIELRTYRFVGHFTVEEALGLNYRSKEEIESWRKRDPLASWAAELETRGILDGKGRAALDAEVDDEVEQAIAFADAAPWPEPEEAFEGMYLANEGGLPVRGWL